MTKFVTLMYHAVYASEQELAAIAPVDRPYAVSVEEFASHLELIRRRRVAVIGAPGGAARAMPRGVQISFDDGHAGWRTHVLPLLLEKAMHGVFFVTSDFIGSPGYCNEVELRALSDAGMEVGAHGKSHGFLGDMDDESCLAELSESRRILEKIVRKPVSSMSFPGGRFTKRTIELGESTGFRRFYTSIPGINEWPIADGGTVMRFDIKPGLRPADFERIIDQDSALIRKVRFIAGAKKRVKSMLGSENYKKLYDRVYSQKSQ